MSDPVPPDGPPPAVVMSQLLGGFQLSQALYVVAKLDICTLLEEKPLTVTELAERSGARPEPLSRLIRTLASTGIFHTTGDLVHTTPLGATLSRTHPETVAHIAEMWMETHYLPFSELLHTVRTGEPGATRYFGKPAFAWVGEDPARARQVARAMADLTGSLRRGMFDAYQLPAGDRVADVGGADGSVLAELIAHRPDRQGILFDLPAMVPSGNAAMVTRRLDDRVAVVAGDFFTEVPEADVYVLSFILHDWDDDAAGRILATIRRSASDGARLLLVEGLVPPGDQPHLIKMVDLTMLGMVPGRERTAEEYTTLLTDAGFVVDRIVTTPTPFSIVEATAAADGQPPRQVRPVG
ncbi:methyltransferase [Paractinoplanes brasiliensis]|uniref:methyltransferase n=1 Tax=Paractinoplanes brasiliensis TaxID=52695 RepID=UPI001414EB9C|nr:methyltransferase [Actinoplanes brasiliensis]